MKAVRVHSPGGPDALLLLEHPPVYTLGRGADARFLGAAAAGDVPVFRAHRGGQVGRIAILGDEGARAKAVGFLDQAVLVELAEEDDDVRVKRERLQPRAR